MVRNYSLLDIQAQDILVFGLWYFHVWRTAEEIPERNEGDIMTQHCTDCGDDVADKVELCSDCTEERIQELHDDNECVIDCPICDDARDQDLEDR